MNQSVEFFTPKQLALEMKVNYRLILNAIAAGELSCMKLSERRWRIRSQAAAQWAANSERKHLTPPIDT